MPGHAMHQSLEPGEFPDGDLSPAVAELVIAPTFVVVPRGPVRRLLDEPVLDEAVESAVESSWAHPHRAVAELRDPAHQRITVELTVKQGCCAETSLLRENVELPRLERLFPNHETVVLDGARHFFQEDAPGQAASAIRETFGR